MHTPRLICIAKCMHASFYILLFVYSFPFSFRVLLFTLNIERYEIMCTLDCMLNCVCHTVNRPFVQNTKHDRTWLSLRLADRQLQSMINSTIELDCKHWLVYSCSRVRARWITWIYSLPFVRSANVSVYNDDVRCTACRTEVYTCITNKELTKYIKFACE